MLSEDNHSKQKSYKTLFKVFRVKKKTKLTTQEEKLLKSYERGEWVPVKKQEREIKKIKSAARLTLAKDSRINIRISSQLLEDLQLKAEEEGLPYQTFIASILHKFSTGRLVDVRNSKVS